MDLDRFQRDDGPFGGYGGHDGYGDYRLPESSSPEYEAKAGKKEGWKPLLPPGVLLWESRNPPSLFSRKLWLESTEG